MPTQKAIDEWDAALEVLREAHEHLRKHIGKPGEAAAQADYEKARKAYEQAATNLD